MRIAIMPYVLLVGILGPAVQAERLGGQESRRQVSAWDTLVRSNYDIPADLTPLEREVLGLMTMEQAESYARGADASSIVLRNGETLETFLLRKGALGFDLSWYSVDGGGAAMSGGQFSLEGIAGQTDAGSMNGGDFNLTGGFFAPLESLSPCTGDSIFCDGFESGDFQTWSLVVSGM